MHDGAPPTPLLDRTERVWTPREDSLWESTDRVITTRELLEDAFGPTRPVHEEQTGDGNAGCCDEVTRRVS